MWEKRPNMSCNQSTFTSHVNRGAQNMLRSVEYSTRYWSGAFWREIWWNYYLRYKHRKLIVAQGIKVSDEVLTFHVEISWFSAWLISLLCLSTGSECSSVCLSSSILLAVCIHPAPKGLTEAAPILIKARSSGPRCVVGAQWLIWEC